jgi:hypothetical protein
MITAPAAAASSSSYADLPDELWVAVLQQVPASHACVRSVCQLFLTCRDAPTTHLNLSGTLVSRQRDHFRAVGRWLEHLLRHMPRLTSINIAQLHSFGPLSSLPAVLHTRLRRLSVDAERWSSSSLRLSLRTLTNLVALEELCLGREDGFRGYGRWYVCRART